MSKGTWLANSYFRLVFSHKVTKSFISFSALMDANMLHVEVKEDKEAVETKEMEDSTVSC